MYGNLIGGKCDIKINFARVSTFSRYDAWIHLVSKRPDRGTKRPSQPKIGNLKDTITTHEHILRLKIPGKIA